jgi:hypothetical protein
MAFYLTSAPLLVVFCSFLRRFVSSFKIYPYLLLFAIFAIAIIQFSLCSDLVVVASGRSSLLQYSCRFLAGLFSLQWWFLMISMTCPWKFLGPTAESTASKVTNSSNKLNLEVVAAAPVPVNTTNNVPDTVFSVLEQEQPLASVMALPLENSFELLKELKNLADGKALVEDLQHVAASSTLTVCNEELVIGSSGAHLALANLPRSHRSLFHQPLIWILVCLVWISLACHLLCLNLSLLNTPL